METAFGIFIYQDDREREPFSEWINGLPTNIRARVFAKIDRIATGNLGDCKSVGEGVFEFRLNFGPGYRIYFGKIGKRIVLLLFGGDKSSQKGDIKKAKNYWKDYVRRER